MRRLFGVQGWQAVKAAFVAFGLGVLMLLGSQEASAGGCPSLSGVKAFSGTASTSFSGMVSGSDNSGGTITVSLARSAQALQLYLPFGQAGPAGTVYGAHPGQSPSGGSISVNDTYNDSNPSGNMSGSESGSGPTVSDGSAAVVNFFPASCTYQFLVQWAIDTTPSGSATPGDDTASGYGQTGLRPIPASLKLSGSITVPDYGDGPSCSKIHTRPCYGNNGGWASEYDSLQTSGPPYGSATITWNLTPSGPKSCSVGGGGTTAAADRGATAAQQTEPVVCLVGSPEPGKIYTMVEKASFVKQRSELLKKFANACGINESYPIWWVRALIGAFVVPATSLLSPCAWIQHYELPSLAAKIHDPPDPAVSQVVLPVVPPARGKRVSCPVSPRTCRRGGHLALAYVRALGQLTAAGDALATSLDRLATTPAKPEDLSASPPVYSRRLQVAAARLYSGLQAAWSERLQTASASIARFLRGLGGKARIASKRLPPVLPAAPLWRTFHQMTVYELAQLTEDLISQQMQVPLTQYAAQHHSAAAQINALVHSLNKVHAMLESDLNAILAAKSQNARSAAANRYAHDARQILAISGLGKYARHASLTAQLLAFGSGALTTSNPKPVTAP